MKIVDGVMRDVVFTGGRAIERMEFPDPTPGPGENLGAMVGLVDRALAVILTSGAPCRRPCPRVYVQPTQADQVTVGKGRLWGMKSGSRRGD